MKYVLLIFYIFILSKPSYASDYCKDLNLGWHFFCEERKNSTDNTTAKPKSLSIDDAKQILKDRQQKLEDLKVLALMDPSYENMVNYINFQNQVIKQSVNFSQNWQDALRLNPDLDFRVKSPYGVVGNEIRSIEKRKNIDQVMNKINKRYGLFFFYKASCPYCISFSKILKDVVDSHHLTVMAITMDKTNLPEWPESKQNITQATHMQMDGKPVPALILYDSKTQQIAPISYGLISGYEIEERLLQIVQAIEVKEKI